MGNNLDRKYQGLINLLRASGNQKSDRTGTGTFSLFGLDIDHDMNEGFPLLTTKKLFTKGIIEELLWFLRGKTNIRPLVLQGVNIWNGDAFKRYQAVANVDSNTNAYKNHNPVEGLMEMDEFVERIKYDENFANKYGELGRVYGAQWRHWRGINKNGANIEIDQIKRLIHDLAVNPDSRRLMVSAWKVDEVDDMVLPPCHFGFQCYTRELSFEERKRLFLKDMLFIDNIGTGVTEEDLENLNIPKRALQLKWNQRSVDTFLGLPFNIASYGFLLHILAKIMNMHPEYLKGDLGDTHIYTNHIEAVDTQLGNENIYNLPQLRLAGGFENVHKYWNGNDFDLNSFLDQISLGDFEITGYKSYPTIKAPLSN